MIWDTNALEPTAVAPPVLDQLATSGLRFEHCYSQPLCTPSRVQIMTGIYNVRNYKKFGILDRGQTTFAHLLKDAGYKTCIAGKWQLGRQRNAPQHFGFDEACLWWHTRRAGRFPNPGVDINGEFKQFSNGEYGPDVVSDFICDFIEKNQDGPFFVYYPMILTHCPFEPTPDSKEWDPSNPGSESYKGDAKYFADMTTYMDKIVGKIVSKLDELDLSENTLVIFTGDNGTDQPVKSMMNGREVAGGKANMTDGGTRVPLIIHWPGTVQAGSISSELVDFSDFLPTVCEAAGVKVPEELNIDGRSFLPLLLGKPGNPREWIYCWYSRSGKVEDAKIWARNQSHKLYSSGEFYHITEDVLEKKPLGEKLSADELKIRTLLQAALNQYSEARKL
jgi:arylsulfatase A